MIVAMGEFTGKIGRLGKLPPKYDERTLRLENYLNVPKLPPLPETSDWFAKVSKFPMAGNDAYGDCGVAGASHMIQTWTANAGRYEQIIPDGEVVRTYLTYTGGEDSGVYLLDFLKYWRKVGMADHRIGAFVALDPKNVTSLRYGNYLFGGLYMGFSLPVTIENQEVWDVPSGGAVGDGAPGSLGGHCVNAGLITPRIIKVGTWGREQTATMRFVWQYCDEAYAILSLEWFTTEHKSPTGFLWKDLQADLHKITK